MRALLLSLSVLGLACSSGDNVGPQPVELEGTWQLVSVNGQALPARVQGGAGRMVTIPSGQIRLIGTDQGTATVKWCEIEDPEPGFPTVPSLSAWIAHWTRVSDSQARLTYPDFTGALPPVDTLTVSGDSLSYQSRIVDSHQWQLVAVGEQPPFHC
jgi:hypothetical protein